MTEAAVLLTMQELAKGEADAREEVCSYRELAQAAIHALHAERRAHVKLQMDYARLDDQYHALRVRVLTESS